MGFNSGFKGLIANKHTYSYNMESRMKVVKSHKKDRFYAIHSLFLLVVLTSCFGK